MKINTLMENLIEELKKHKEIKKIKIIDFNYKTSKAMEVKTFIKKAKGGEYFGLIPLIYSKDYQRNEDDTIKRDENGEFLYDLIIEFIEDYILFELQSLPHKAPAGYNTALRILDNCEIYHEESTENLEKYILIIKNLAYRYEAYKESDYKDHVRQSEIAEKNRENKELSQFTSHYKYLQTQKYIAEQERKQAKERRKQEKIEREKRKIEREFNRRFGKI